MKDEIKYSVTHYPKEYDVANQFKSFLTTMSDFASEIVSIDFIQPSALSCTQGHTDLHEIKAALFGGLHNPIPAGVVLEDEVTSQRDDAWRTYDQASSDVERKKDDLLDDMGNRMKQRTEQEQLFVVRWICYSVKN